MLTGEFWIWTIIYTFMETNPTGFTNHTTMKISKTIRRIVINAIAGLLFLFFIPSWAQDRANNEKADNETTNADSRAVYELRLYYPNDGKLGDLLARFRNHTTGLFEKHGFTNVGYWVTRPGEEPSVADRMMAVNDGKEALLYIVSFPDMEARNASWEAFVNDPEWIKVYEDSRVNGALIREIHQVFLNPTDFSTLK